MNNKNIKTKSKVIEIIQILQAKNLCIRGPRVSTQIKVKLSKVTQRPNFK